MLWTLRKKRTKKTLQIVRDVMLVSAVESDKNFRSYRSQKCPLVVMQVGWITSNASGIEGKVMEVYYLWSLNFSIDVILPAAMWPWSESTCIRNEYQESSWWYKGRPSGNLIAICEPSV
jgi:hypothetical protein